MVRPTMVCARSCRIAATVELSTPPDMATATVLKVATVGLLVASSNWVSDDNCLVLFVCETDETNSKATSTVARPASRDGRYIIQRQIQNQQQIRNREPARRLPTGRQAGARKIGQAEHCHAEIGAFELSGDSAWRRSNACGITAIAWSISSAVVVRPRLRRRLLRASSGERPMARSTCDGPTAPDEQAAPVEQAMPCRSSAITSASPPAA